MDKYSVKRMSRALRDLDGIYDYIAHTLLEPGTALNLVGRTEDANPVFGEDVLPLPGTETRGLRQPRIPAAFWGELHRRFSY